MILEAWGGGKISNHWLFLAVILHVFEHSMLGDPAHRECHYAIDIMLPWMFKIYVSRGYEAQVVPIFISCAMANVIVRRDALGCEIIPNNSALHLASCQLG